MMNPRTIMRWLHRWLGLTAGLIFAALALSGSMLLFQAQFFSWAHGDLIPPNLDMQPAAIDAWVANARTVAPHPDQLIVAWPPHTSHNISDAGMLIFGGGVPGGIGHMGFTGVLVAPATGELLGTIDIDRSPAYAPLFFHRNLLAGPIGSVLAAGSSALCLAMLLLGAYLWWPRGRVARKLTGRPWRALRRAAPLHHWLGIWTTAPLFVLAFTGIYLAQPAWLEPGLQLLPNGHDEPELAACESPISFDTAIERGRELVPAGSQWTGVFTHDGAWELSYRSPNSLDPEFGDYHVYADLDCGQVALAQTPESRSSRETAKTWLIYLHDGSIFGVFGEIVVALFGLAPFVLAWAGIRMWLRRRRKRQSLNRKLENTHRYNY